MDTIHRFEVHYTEAIARSAVRRFMLRRGLSWRLVLSGALVMAMAGVLLATGDRSWVLGVTVTVPLLGFLLVAAVWRLRLREASGRVRRMEQQRAEFVLDEAGIAVTSSLGHSAMPWSAVTETWAQPGYWMLFIAPNNFFTLPTAEVPAAAMAFLRSRVTPR
ncbi:YcxB family protein [Roseomonas sp. BN140053]|uniref:YcxB family protein n=1 Tax=Roseomonas sp. BN140053 TaxID=3391898 RepID=UPI0039E9868B